ncbi:sulfite transporter TauE/SafE [Solibacillus sp. R5-41]|uniref:sulfite exporter TauE/SafE family protein n=1 Tax=Solibacillus sp. R5-41 TaxID=2048654 RepID=UPI000C12577D|nr:sulfite exporter TauE/SafE family protein [Solibacillus sp. R5-41]ATP38861.1 sulfite transporter TauE/SafE [Solibacillus sp. R5-41]
MWIFLRLATILFIGILLLTQINSSSSTEFLLILIGVGIIASFIGTLAGGGGLITLPAMMLLGIPIQFSIATNKFSSGIASLSSLFVLLKARELKWTTIRKYIVYSIIGGGIGAFVTSCIPESWLNSIALFLLLFALGLSLKSNKWYNEASNQNEDSKDPARISIVSFFIGIYDGGFGPGSSSFSILYFLKSGFTYVKATQMSRVLNFGSCLGAFIVFYQTGFLQWDYAIALATGSIIGTQIALLIVAKIPLRFAKWLLTIILVLLIGQVALEII